MLVGPEYLRKNPAMADPLSDVLELTGAQCVMSGGFHAGPHWAIRFPPPQMIKFVSFAKGHAWFRSGELPALHLETGDVLLINQTHPFTLASDLRLPPRDAMEVFASKVDGITHYDDGDDVFMLGGHVTLNPARGHLLRDILPPFIHVQSAAPEAEVMRMLLAQLRQEINEARVGMTLATTHLAQLMFVQVLRAHMQSTPSLTSGWLQALADERIARALGLMHAEPGRVWNLEALAKAANMSRTTFTDRFKQTMGVAPLAYFTRWRMYLAERALSEKDTPIGTLAFDLGYASESAFSHAFKRNVGVAPRRYRLRAQAGLESWPTDQ